MAARKKAAVKKEDNIIAAAADAVENEVELAPEKALEALLTGDKKLQTIHEHAAKELLEQLDRLIDSVKIATKYGHISGIQTKIAELRNAAGLSEDDDDENVSAGTFQKSIAKYGLSERRRLFDEFVEQLHVNAEFGIPDITKWLLSKNIKSNLTTGNVKDIFQTWDNRVSRVMSPDDPKEQKKDGRKLLFKKKG